MLNRITLAVSVLVLAVALAIGVAYASGAFDGGGTNCDDVRRDLAQYGVPTHAPPAPGEIRLEWCGKDTPTPTPR